MGDQLGGSQTLGVAVVLFDAPNFLRTPFAWRQHSGRAARCESASPVE
jgi:hypothetical protein